MQIVKAGTLYFALVFGVGFVLGTIRTRWVVPRVGTRMAGASRSSSCWLRNLGSCWLRGLSIKEYFATRDPVSGTVYYVMLGVFAIMPLFVARR
jgi:hypothetical protein